ncbi:PH domain-containing protein [Haladaptatus cibarius]|uniref:PH domain-containing protein n=1 Tax=Haladaptatus cibarius TaxID=453847 RepID=UPI0006798519|nr:PH domain-containing protein [Haladaptatus cibarius]
MTNDFDSSWLHLTPDEEVLWAGHRSVYNIVPAVLAGVIFILLGAGVGGSDFFGPARWLAIALVPLGFIVAVPPFLRWRSEWYVLTTEEIYHKSGILSTNVTQIRLDRVQNTSCSQSLSERIFDYGDVTVYTAGSGTIDLVFRNVSNPQSINELLTEQLGRVSTRR